ncbi:MAG: hypothetical protein LAO79_28695 [Acidobacteriia bacterium]|nr:hypothetical protein [Terriglobia bacterium]
MMPNLQIRWPGNRPFAFTVIDDTDWATVQNVKPVYDLLADLGFRTTKTVWMFQSENGINPGETCEDAEYRSWVVALQNRGFEIALHNAAAGTSDRVRSLRALDGFRDLFGNDTAIHCNHTGCLENLYWGDTRLSGWRRGVYRSLTRGVRTEISRGHVAGDPLFWGDACRERVRYVRNFVFDQLNTLKMCPEMPYYDPAKPYVNLWFASADAGNLATFLRNFTYAAIDRLVSERGLCIVYSHFGGGFAPGGHLDREFANRMTYIAGKGGWFAPVSTVLDHLRGEAGADERIIAPAALASLESRWLQNRTKVEVAKKVRRALRPRK